MKINGTEYSDKFLNQVESSFEEFGEALVAQRFHNYMILKVLIIF